MRTWFEKCRTQKNAPSLLDVGSGLGVFVARMKLESWRCSALDPDPEAAAHASRHIGVSALCGDFMRAQQLAKYDLITFNKVLEHVANPVEMLKRSAHHLLGSGIVYVEVPDGEAAANDGPNREEFFIEHLHVFSLTSLSLLASSAGLVSQLIERVREPSSKYTLRAFLSL
jgi:2-polyprenyl-3-methyl-5-hydroxy-6-metoxy-1,4-benzoquinol methylase